MIDIVLSLENATFNAARLNGFNHFHKININSFNYKFKYTFKYIQLYLTLLIVTFLWKIVHLT